jgi:myo-inositol-1-phosphate synthase
MVDSNRLLCKALEAGTVPKEGKGAKGEHPDHIAVIKYVPAVGNSKGLLTSVTKRSSVVAGRLFASSASARLVLCLQPAQLHAQGLSRQACSVLSLSPLSEGLSLMIDMRHAVVNSLSPQRNALETFLKACIGLEGNSDLLLETGIW